MIIHNLYASSPNHVWLVKGRLFWRPLPNNYVMASPGGKDPEPGSGIRNTRTTHAFRAINFELFAKPVSLASRCISSADLARLQ